MHHYKKTISAFLAALFAVAAVSGSALAAPAVAAAAAVPAAAATEATAPALDADLLDEIPSLTDLSSAIYDSRLELNMLAADADQFGPADPDQAAIAPADDTALPPVTPTNDAIQPADGTQAAPELMYSSTRAQRVIAHARTHMGDPYKFGAEGPRYWDCSSFVQHVYRQAVGISLPRTSLYQSRRGTFVSKANLRPGDLVFFKNTWRAGVSHVGIYIGNQKMIHAWPGAGVTIGDMSRPYFVSHYWGARRVL
ncbi:MAG: C40 family peptidase [Bacillota bacterium]